MKKLFWLTVGIFAGIEIKKQIDKNPNAQALVADVTARAKEFGETASEAFMERTAELTGSPRPAASKTKSGSKTTARKPAARKPAAAKSSKPKSAAKKSSPSKPAAK
jgi:hypothetical protein